MTPQISFDSARAGGKSAGSGSVDDTVCYIHADVEDLRQQLAECCEEMQALKACLAAKGVLQLEAVAEQIQRKREMALWSEVIMSGKRTFTIASFAGPEALYKAASCSKACNDIIKDSHLIDSLSDSSMIYVCGGKDLHDQPLSSVECLHVKSGAWRALPHMLTKRSHVVAAAVGGKLYACGGRNDSGSLRSVECYSPMVDTWEVMPSMAQARESPMLVSIDDVLYVFGGTCFPGDSLRSAERFCTTPPQGEKMQDWEPLEPMSRHHYAACAGVLHGAVYICGGFAGTERLHEVQKFAPPSLGSHLLFCASWCGMPPMKKARAGAAAAVSRDKLYVYGGLCKDEPVSSVELYDPGHGRWDYVALMPASFCVVSTVSLQGEVYVLGGESCSLDHLTSETAKVYAQETGSWVEVSPMISTRLLSAAAVVAI